MQHGFIKLVVGFQLVLAASIAYGETYEWIGPSGSATFPLTGPWDAASNWTGGLPVPEETSTLLFGGAGFYTATNDFQIPVKLNALRLAPLNPVTLNGGTLEFVNDGANGSRIQLDTNSQVSVLSSVVNNGLLTVTGSGLGRLSIGRGAAPSDGVISGTGAIIVNTSPTALTEFYAANTYSGDTTLIQGKLSIGRSSDGTPESFSSGPFGTGTLNLNGGVISVSTSGSFSLNNAVAIGGNITLGSGAEGGQNSLTFQGSTTLTGSDATRVLTLNLAGYSDRTVLFAGAIVDNGYNNGIAINGSGTLVLGGVNNYGGATTVNGAEVILSGSNASSSATIVNGGLLKVTQNTGAPLGAGSITVNGGELSFVPTGFATITTGSIEIINGGSVGLWAPNPAAGGGSNEILLANVPEGTFTYGNGFVAVSGSNFRYTIGPLTAAENSVLKRKYRGSLVVGFSSEYPQFSGNKLIVNGGVSTAYGMVSPTIVGQAALGNGFFLNYDPAIGFVRAVDVVRSGTFKADQYEITWVKSPSTITSSNPNALRVDQTTLSIQAGDVVKIGNGAGQAGIILNPTQSSDSRISGGTLDFGLAEGVIYVGGNIYNPPLRDFYYGRVESVVTGSGGVTKFGPGTLFLPGANTFSGGLVINDGVVIAGGTETVVDGVITSSSVGTGTITFAGGGMRASTVGDRIVSNSIIIASAVYFPPGSLSKNLTFAGPVTLMQTDNTFDVQASGAINFAGVIGENAPGRNLHISGGLLVLGGGVADGAPNTYTGTTYTRSGRIILNKQAGTDAFRGDLVINSFGKVFLQQPNQIPDTSKVTINGGFLMLQSQQTGVGMAETLGDVTINAGELQTNPSGTGSNSVSITTVLQTGGKFAVNAGARVKVDNFTMSGGTLSFGESADSTGTPASTSPSVLTAESITIQGDSTLSFRLDKAVIGRLVTGSISLLGSEGVLLTLSLGFDPTDEGMEQFTIVENTGATAIAGVFRFENSLLSENSEFVVSTGDFTQAFRISYHGGTGNDVVLTAVPEPNSALLLAGGLGMLLSLRRHHRRK